MVCKVLIRCGLRVDDLGRGVGAVSLRDAPLFVLDVPLPDGEQFLHGASSSEAGSAARMPAFKPAGFVDQSAEDVEDDDVDAVPRISATRALPCPCLLFRHRLNR